MVPSDMCETAPNKFKVSLLVSASLYQCYVNRTNCGGSHARGIWQGALGELAGANGCHQHSGYPIWFPIWFPLVFTSAMLTEPTVAEATPEGSGKERSGNWQAPMAATNIRGIPLVSASLYQCYVNTTNCGKCLVPSDMCETAPNKLFSRAFHQLPCLRKGG